MSRPVDAAARPPRVRLGIWGLFDVEGLEAAVIPRVLRAEITRRLPAASVRSFAPFGSERPTRWDGGEPSDPLGPWSPERVAELADGLDAVIVAGELVLDDATMAAAYGVPAEEAERRAPSRFLIEGLGPELETESPVVLFAAGVPGLAGAGRRAAEALRPRPAISVTDEASRERLADAGVDRDIVVVPHPAVLLARILETDVLDRRLEYLRVMEWFPRGDAVLVHGRGGADAPAVAEGLLPLLSARDDLTVVCLELEPGDGGFADALARALGDRARRPGALTLEDVAAVVRASTSVVTSSVPLIAAALGFDRPAVLLDPSGDPRVEAAAAAMELPDGVVRSARDAGVAVEKAMAQRLRGELGARLQAAVDAELDRVAAIAADAAAARAIPAGADELDGLRRRLEVLRAGHATRGRLLVRQRWTFADRVRDAEAAERRARAELEERIRALEAERARLEAEIEGKDRELRTLLNTRTFRYTAGLRRIWGRLRGMLRP